MVDEAEYLVVPIDTCQPNQFNPQVQDLDTFNNLVANIKELGFIEPIQVVRNDDGSYMIVGGEHRWKAAKLAGLREIRVVVVNWDEDVQKIQAVKLNILHGRFNPAKFSQLFLELERKYGRVELLRRLGMQNRERLVEQLLRRVKGSLPPAIQAGLEKRRDDIRNVEDLATIIQSLYAQYGSTLEYNYMFFTFAGKLHLMVKLRRETLGKLKTALDDGATDVNDLLERALNRVATRS